MGVLTHDAFFAKLTELFIGRRAKDHGAIYLTQKRYSYGQALPAPTPENPFPELHPASPVPLLIRATNGKGGEKKASKVKLSTLVEPADLEAFYGRYADVCKTGMSALKPRDRTKRKAKAKKKKVGVSQAV
ncbi:signal recognition particle, SRP9/SRP14 subunit [Lasiosphaeris hirsuta]|uniref:Signal recognition particle subunit SRP14 n=1 Tax=Lasiosphaeris hirsuta TaxID=260670 RepID=A0AA40AZB8_9PEZI|nr:signal recognition particle, SRP9/SRP14 subunit [Lasiosphaeris hirsuta]